MRIEPTSTHQPPVEKRPPPEAKPRPVPEQPAAKVNISPAAQQAATDKRGAHRDGHGR
jgi:hypothetical protein